MAQKLSKSPLCLLSPSSLYQQYILFGQNSIRVLQQCDFLSILNEVKFLGLGAIHQKGIYQKCQSCYICTYISLCSKHVFEGEMFVKIFLTTMGYGQHFLYFWGKKGKGMGGGGQPNDTFFYISLLYKKCPNGVQICPHSLWMTPSYKCTTFVSLSERGKTNERASHSS